LILDEPTALLTPGEVERLFVLLRRVVGDGGAVVLVTHKVDEIAAIADAITVLRAGRTVAELPGRAAPAEIARAMVGGEPPARVSPPPPPVADAEVVLAARDLDGIDLVIRAGEVVGVAGVEGNGQRELVLALTGLAQPSRGRVELGGVDVTTASVAARRAAGLAHVPDDRHRYGLILDASLADNLVLGRTAEISRWGGWVIDSERLRALATKTLMAHGVRPAEPARLARSLSGGNQQKLVVARELSRPGVRVVIAAQPTRGVDLGAVAGIHDRLRAIAAAGAGVLLLSADLDELFALSHRIVVLHRGRIAGELTAAELTPVESRARLGRWMTGAA
jgi:simple sugar transport system ATP-binding protein